MSDPTRYRFQITIDVHGTAEEVKGHIEDCLDRNSALHVESVTELDMPIALEVERLRAVVDQIAKRGESTFRVGFHEKNSLIVTGPTDREVDMAKLIVGLLDLGSTVEAGKRSRKALEALLTAHYLYGRDLGRGWNGAIYDAVKALGGEALAQMTGDEAYKALGLQDEDE